MKRVQLVRKGPAKRALTDAKAESLSRRLSSLIKELQTVELGTRIGLPLSPGWRYREPGDARAELVSIIKRLLALTKEYPQ